MAVLLDVNVIVALVVREHVHHDAADEWFAGLQDDFATCPIVEGGLVRFLLREGRSAQDAQQVLAGFALASNHEFWPDELPFDAVSLDGVMGHRQVTDAYLAGLARARDGSIATFDTGLASLHSDVASLIPK